MAWRELGFVCDDSTEGCARTTHLDGITVDAVRQRPRPLCLGIVLLGDDATTLAWHEVSAVLAVATNLVFSFLHDVVLGLSVREVKKGLFGAACTTEDVGPIIPSFLAVGYPFDVFVDESFVLLKARPACILLDPQGIVRCVCIASSHL